MNTNISTKISSLAKKFETDYGIPEKIAVQFLDCNSEVQVVKFALNGDFISQNVLAEKLKELLEIKLEKKGVN